MKIFNWVHRRFSQKDGFGRNVKKDKVMFGGGAIPNSGGDDTEMLLQHNAAFDGGALKGWGGGILSIGTFGFEDPLNELHDDEQEQNHYYYRHQKLSEIEFSGELLQKYGEHNEESSGQLQSDDYCTWDYDDDEHENHEEEEEGELNPLVPAAFALRQHELDQSGEEGFDINDHINALKAAADAMRVIDSTQLEMNYIIRDEMMSKKKERVTLADLFSADSDDKNRPSTNFSGPKIIDEVGDYGDDAFLTCKKSAAPKAKPGLSFAKKLIPRVKEDSPPIQKLQKMMTRMLKRKIHPDSGGKTLKDCENNENGGDMAREAAVSGAFH